MTPSSASTIATARPSDAELQQLFTDIITTHRQLIYKVCYMYAADAEHLKDLYQEVVASVWQGLPNFRQQSAVATWLYRVAINTCVGYFRRNGKMSITVPIEEVVHLEADSDDHLANLREMYRLINGLRKLDKAIILLWLDEHPYEEIAEITGLKRNAVASRLRRIKQQLVERSNS
ncbi:MAG: sigma-70 family RNA polymerase sigma factor [Bacteroidales bacterium]|nr:sigma-70 family RNA polymerase sigma factor [Bacteroidales bacterium]